MWHIVNTEVFMFVLYMVLFAWIFVRAEEPCTVCLWGVVSFLPAKSVVFSDHEIMVAGNNVSKGC